MLNNLFREQTCRVTGADIEKPHTYQCGAFLCPWMDGMSQRAMDGGEMNVHGWTVFRKKPGKAVRLCTGSTVFCKEPWKAVQSLQFT